VSETCDIPISSRIVVTRRLPTPVEDRLAAHFDARLNTTDRPFGTAEMAAALRTADILVPTVTDRLDADLLSQAGPQLKLVANFGAGVDHIDLAAATKRGLTVTNTPGVLTEDTADLAFTLILGVLRRLREGLRELESGTWQGWAPTGLRGRRVAGTVLGIVGMGRIGQAVAHRARAFGMEIHYHNRRRLPEVTESALEARFHPDLDSLLEEIDLLSLHCPLTPKTRHLISDRRLARMKRGSRLVNTARGGIVDEAALIKALRSGHLAGAGLDVYEAEPRLPAGLLELPNVLALPHMGSATDAARIAMGEKVLENIAAFARGEAPPDRVRL